LALLIGATLKLERPPERRNDMAVRKTAEGAKLKRWFKEKWVDVRTGKACGRRKGEKRGTPYCRPSKRVSSKTPKTSSELSASEKKSRIAQKKRLGQPAGKPRRVKSVRRRKK
tara:strand:- start:2279 stop:2617 length:339 start_codon:yes stop_codon:yes gene_type:complete